MKFLVTMHFNRGNAEDVATLVKTGQEFFQSRAQSGNLECAYATLEHPAKIIAIMSADSNEAALKLVAENPLAPLATMCVQPLADVSAAFEGAAARVG